MSRRPDHPLRALTDLEREALRSISRSQMEPAAHVARAKELLAVSEGCSFSEAARRAGRKSGDAVAHLVVRFNENGLSALQTRHGGGWKPTYGDAHRRRILQEVERAPRLEIDGTLTWSLSTLRDALRRAPDGLPEVSTYTIWQVLHEAGYTWQRDRSWCPTGQVERKRKAGLVTVVDPDADAKKNSSKRPIPAGKPWD